MGLRQQKEQCALAMIFRGRPGALEAIGEFLAGLVAHLPPPAEPLTPGEDHFEHTDELGPLLLAGLADARARSGLLRWRDARHITQQDGKRIKLIIGNRYLALAVRKRRRRGNKRRLPFFSGPPCSADKAIRIATPNGA